MSSWTPPRQAGVDPLKASVCFVYALTKQSVTWLPASARYIVTQAIWCDVRMGAERVPRLFLHGFAPFFGPPIFGPQAPALGRGSLLCVARQKIAVTTNGGARVSKSNDFCSAPKTIEEN